MTSPATPPRPRGRDPDLPDLRELMKTRVQEILLVSSLYDSFILSEDGQIEELIHNEFLELNLRYAPSLTHVSSGADAIDALRENPRINLVITSMRVADMTAADLARRVRAQGWRVPVVGLAYDTRELADVSAHDADSPLEQVFLWQGDAKILLAIVKWIEDKLNLERDVGRIGVPLIIVVEDSVRFYSSFLPTIYTVLVKHSQQLIDESLNLSHKLQRLRGRPKIVLADTYEKAWEMFDRYGAETLGVISDIEFPRDGRPCPTAGVDLARAIRRVRPEMAIILQSSRPENARLAEEVDAAFLLKGSPLMLQELRRIMNDSFAFGDFVFRAPDGSEIARARDLSSLVRQIRTVPGESLVYHGSRHDFSNWLKARTEFRLAHRLRRYSVDDFDDPEALRRVLIEAVESYRSERHLGIVTDFERGRYDATTRIARIGSGSLGGKARGLAFVHKLLHRYGIADRFEGIEIAVPRTVVLSTEVFDEFVDQDGLRDLAINSDDDREIEEQFCRARFPAAIEADLARFLDVVRAPLAVRSSSLLEDSQYQPLAGVYETYMLPNDDPDPRVRLRALTRAIARVYASTFSSQAKSFLRATPYRLEEERMGVIVQKIVGSAHGTCYYPHFAGVARSHNFYPTPPLEPEDGIAAVALGLGKTVVDGECCLRFSPAHPRHVVQFSSPAQALANSQKSFWAVRLGPPVAGAGDAGSLVRCGLDGAERDGTLAFVGSTYDAEDDRIRDGLSHDGPRIVTFAPILEHDLFPLARILDELLELGVHGASAPVEIEFAVNLTPPPGRRKEFGFLQMRPLAISRELEDLQLGNIDPAAAICWSDSVLGNGKIEGIHDIVFVDARAFDRAASRDTAAAVGALNARLVAEGRPYVLIGVGRWGSADPWLGIPVTWEQIHGARAIVEAGFRDFKVEPSQGTHFFQNLVSCNVGYFTVNPQVSEGLVDWCWLTSQPAVETIGPVRHVRTEAPIVVKMNGRRTEGVIFKPGATTR